MAVIVSDGKLTLTGYVGDHWQWGDEVIVDGFTQAMVMAALAEIGDDADLTVHINSGGGMAYEGVAIRAVLADRSGRTDVVIDGIAASAASVVAMVGDTITMAEGATLMIHDPSGLTIGTVADHEASIRQLNSLATNYARIYAKRAGIDDAAARKIMVEETWFTAAEAVAAGFADSESGNIIASIIPFPYQSYAHAPRELVAKAKEEGWGLPATRIAAAAARRDADPAPATAPETGKSRSRHMSQTEGGMDPNASALAERERIKAILTSDSAKGRESQASHLALNSSMSADEALAFLETFEVQQPKSSIPTIEERARGMVEAGPGSGGFGRRQAGEWDADVFARAGVKRKGA